MKTIEGASALRPMVSEEGNIRFVFTGGENKPSVVGFELPIDELTERSLIQIREKVLIPGRCRLTIQVCERSIPFEFSDEISRGSDRLVSDVRMIIFNARDDAYVKRLVKVGEMLEEARKNAHKIN